MITDAMEQLERDIRSALDKFGASCPGDADYAEQALEVLDGFVSSLEQLEIDTRENEED